MIDFESEAVTKVKERYNQIHPLIVHRSMERAKSPGDLFDILDCLWSEIKASPSPYPVVWHEEQRRWVKTDDIFQSLVFIAKQKGQKGE